MGAIINSMGIVLGGILALTVKKPLAGRYQLAAQVALGVYTVWFGLQLAWGSFHGTFGQAARELCIVLVGMTVGKLIGQGLHLQIFSNSVGQFANRSLAAAATKSKREFSDGFVVATALFCVGPLAILASVQEGLDGFSPMFVVKAIMDGLATMAFCATLSWGAAAAALPVFAFQALVIRAVELLAPTLRHQTSPVIDSIKATDGFLIFCVAMIILDIKKVRVADYLPSLIVVPLLMRWLW